MNSGRPLSRVAAVGRRRIMTLFLSLLFFHSSPTHAALAVNGRLFDSMPAIFGSPWVNNVQYQAHLQELPARPFLCESDEGRHVKEHNSVSMELEPFQDSLPVALLVSRGACSFEEKAREAIKLPNVAFLIVYDDRSRTQLVPMSGSYEGEAMNYLLFVSHSTGLRKFVY